MDTTSNVGPTGGDCAAVSTSPVATIAMKTKAYPLRMRHLVPPRPCDRFPRGRSQQFRRRSRTLGGQRGRRPKLLRQLHPIELVLPSRDHNLRDTVTDEIG